MMVDGKTKIDSGDFWCKCQMNAVNDDKSGVFRDYKVGDGVGVGVEVGVGVGAGEGVRICCG